MAETKLDISGDTNVAQREIDKLTRKMALLREENRKLGENSKKTSDSWSTGMDRMGQQTDKFAQGLAKLSEQMKRLQEGQFGAFKNLKPGTGGGQSANWMAGMNNLATQQARWAAGMNNLRIQQEAYRNGLVPVVTMQDRFRGHLIHSTVAAKNLGSAMQSSVMASASGYASLAVVLAGVTSEMRGQVEAARELAQFQQGAAGSQRGFLRNLGVVSDKERSAVLGEISRISKTSGVAESQLYGAATQATAAKGSLSNLEAMKSLAVAAMVAPDDPAELAATTGGLLDTASLTGTSNAMQNLGVMAALGEQTRVGSLKDISENLVPAAIGVKGFGGTTGDAAALVTAMTQGTKDTTGRMSGTASISLAKQLSEFLPEKDVYEYDAKGKKKLKARGTGLSDTASRIERLQNDAALREKFMAQATFEAKATIPSRDLLTGGTAAAELYQRSRGAYVTGSAAEAQGQRYIQGLGATGLQQNAAEGRGAAQIAEDLKLRRLRAGAEGNAYEAYNQVQTAAGFGGFSRTVGQGEVFLRSLFTGSANTAAADALQAQLDTTPLESKNPEIAASFKEMIVHLRSIDARLGGTKPNGKVNIDAHTE